MSIGHERAFVYVANAESRELLIFKLDPDSGALTLVEHVLGGKFTTLCATPDGRFMFAGLRDEPFGIASFAIDSQRGVLQPIGEMQMPGPLAYIATDRSGRTLLAASYHNDFVALSEIGADGALRKPHQIIPGIAKAHAVMASPANDRVVATSLGSDRVIVWPFDAVTGRINESAAVEYKVSSGAGPRHLRFHPKSQRIFVLCELDASLRAFDIDSSGQLREGASASAVPKGFRGKRWAAELQIAADGRFVYASERTSSTIISFALNPNGKIETRGSMVTERQPRAFTIDPTGRFMFVVGQKSNRLSVYSIDRETGSLAKLDDYPVGDDPSWIEVLTLPA